VAGKLPMPPPGDINHFLVAPFRAITILNAMVRDVLPHHVDEGLASVLLRSRQLKRPSADGSAPPTGARGVPTGPIGQKEP